MASIEKRDHPSGITYRVKVRLKGYPVQTATFERITDAKRWAQQTEAAIREGRHFKTAQSKRHTLGELIDKYITTVLPQKPKSIRDQKRQLLWWKAQLGDYMLADITPAIIAQKRDELLSTPIKIKDPKREDRQRSPSTVVRYMAALSHALTVAVNDWGWLDDTPMRKVNKPKEPRGRVRFLSEDERKAILKACKESPNKSLYIIVVLALATGMRQGEVMNLRWQDVDFERKRLTLHQTKNGERRAVHLSAHVLEMLRAHERNKRTDSDLLFPSTTPKRESLRNGKPVFAPLLIRKAWLNACAAANLHDFKFHDLRHSTASYLAMNGASLAEIAEVLGQKTLQMVKRYAHLSEGHTSKVVAAMNERIFG